LKPLVTNAGDASQVEKASKREKSRQRQFKKDMRVLLALPEARRYLWALMSDCKVFGSVMATDAFIQYNSGMQDVGHRILADITEASPDALLVMMKENQPQESEDETV
jgi:hypothetical protein